MRWGMEWGAFTNIPVPLLPRQAGGGRRCLGAPGRPCGESVEEGVAETNDSTEKNWHIFFSPFSMSCGGFVLQKRDEAIPLPETTRL